MNVEFLIQMLDNKLLVLNNARTQSLMAGDLDAINKIDADILDTQNTVAKLKMILDISNKAAAVNATPSEVISSGVEALQATDPVTIQGPSASAVVNGYDISAYATDPLHEQKIQTIVNAMPAMATVGDVDSYIQKFAPGSPVTGAMIAYAAKQYNVDIPLLIAIMQNDSSFGTLGIGATTFNPGNVGNNGTDTRTYPSWQDGVSAVAEWLNRHRVITEVVVAPVEQTPIVDTTPLPIITPVVVSTTTPPITPSPVEPDPNPAPSIPVPPNDTGDTGSTTDNGNGTGDNGTSTPPLGGTSDTSNSTSTDPSETQFEVVPLDTTSTSTVSTTSPQARKMTSKSKRRMV